MISLTNDSSGFNVISTDLNFCHTCNNTKFVADNSAKFSSVNGPPPTFSDITTASTQETQLITETYYVLTPLVSSSITLTSSSLQCTWCGNNLVEANESCEDINQISNDGCSSECVQETGYTCAHVSPFTCSTTCGDGLKVGTEECDDDDIDPGDGCDS